VEVNKITINVKSWQQWNTNSTWQHDPSIPKRYLLNYSHLLTPAFLSV